MGLIKTLENGNRILAGQSSSFWEFAPHRRTIRFEDKLYQIALPRLFFLNHGGHFQVFIGKKFPDPEEMQIVKTDGSHWYISEPFVPWHFYNVRGSTGDICLGGYFSVNNHFMVNRFWGSRFNRGMRTSAFMRPMFVKQRLLPIVNLRQWSGLTGGTRNSSTNLISTITSAGRGASYDC